MVKADTAWATPDLPNVSIMDMARDYYRIERDGKYLGAIGFNRDNNWYTAWAGGQELARSRTLLGAAKAFEEIQ